MCVSELHWRNPEVHVIQTYKHCKRRNSKIIFMNTGLLKCNLDRIKILSRSKAHKSNCFDSIMFFFVKCFSLVKRGDDTATAARDGPMNRGMEAIRSLIQLVHYWCRGGRRKKSMPVSLWYLWSCEVKAERRYNRAVFSRPSGLAKREKLGDVLENKRCSLEMVTQSDSLWLTASVLLDEQRQ